MCCSMSYAAAAGTSFLSSDSHKGRPFGTSSGAGFLTLWYGLLRRKDEGVAVASAKYAPAVLGSTLNLCSLVPIVVPSAFF